MTEWLEIGNSTSMIMGKSSILAFSSTKMGLPSVRNSVYNRHNKIWIPSV